MMRRKIKKTEEEIRHLLRAEGESASAAKRALDKLLEFYSTIDKLETASHTKLIRYLYCRPVNKQETLIHVAWKNALSESTLYRYRQKYIHCFFIYYQQELENKANRTKVVNILFF